MFEKFFGKGKSDGEKEKKDNESGVVITDSDSVVTKKEYEEEIEKRLEDSTRWRDTK